MSTRCLMLMSIFGLAWLAQTAMHSHLSGAEPFQTASLTRPLSEFPLKLGPWTGFDRPITDPTWHYADSHVNRAYYNTERGQSLSLWMAYSAAGQDRNHNPEVCMPAHGKHEDPSQRQVVPVEKDRDPIQQFRFVKPRGERGEWVFYWHYTLVPRIDQEQTTPLQRLYLLRRWRPSSLTIEVFAPDIAEDDVVAARAFAIQVDRLVHAHLPPGAVRGCQRNSIRLFNEGGIH